MRRLCAGQRRRVCEAGAEMRANAKTQRAILARWPGAKILGATVRLRCGCEYPVAQMVAALKK